MNIIHQPGEQLLKLGVFLGGGADDGDIIKREKKAAIQKWEKHSLKEITNHHFFKQLKGVC